MLLPDGSKRTIAFALSCLACAAKLIAADAAAAMHEPMQIQPIGTSSSSSPIVSATAVTATCGLANSLQITWLLQPPLPSSPSMTLPTTWRRGLCYGALPREIFLAAVAPISAEPTAYSPESAAMPQPPQPIPSRAPSWTLHAWTLHAQPRHSSGVACSMAHSHSHSHSRLAPRAQRACEPHGSGSGDDDDDDYHPPTLDGLRLLTPVGLDGKRLAWQPGFTGRAGHRRQTDFSDWCVPPKPPMRAGPTRRVRMPNGWVLVPGRPAFHGAPGIPYVTTGLMPGTGWQGRVPAGYVARLDTNELMEIDELEYHIGSSMYEGSSADSYNRKCSEFRRRHCTVEGPSGSGLPAFREALTRYRFGSLRGPSAAAEAKALDVKLAKLSMTALHEWAKELEALLQLSPAKRDLLTRILHEINTRWGLG